MHSADDVVMCLGDSNGLRGRHIDGCDSWTYGVGQRNFEEYYLSFVWGKNYVCKIHGLRERKRGR